MALQGDRRRCVRRQRGAGADRARLRVPADDRGSAGHRHRAAVLFRQLAGRAGGRQYPAQGAGKPASPVAELLRGKQPERNFEPDDFGHRDHRNRGGDDGFGRAAQQPDRNRRHPAAALSRALAHPRLADRDSAGARADRVLRAQDSQGFALQPGPGRRCRGLCHRSAERDADRPELRPGKARGQTLRRCGRANLRQRETAHPAARGDDLDRHRADLWRDHDGHVARRARGVGRRHHRGHDHRFRADRRAGRRRVRFADRSLWRSAARSGRGGPAGRAATRRAGHRPAAQTAAAARARARQPVVPQCQLHLSQPPRRGRDRRPDAGDRAGGNRRAGRPVWGGQVDALHARPAVLRSR